MADGYTMALVEAEPGYRGMTGATYPSIFKV